MTARARALLKLTSIFQAAACFGSGPNTEGSAAALITAEQMQRAALSQSAGVACVARQLTISTTAVAEEARSIAYAILGDMMKR